MVDYILAENGDRLIFENGDLWQTEVTDGAPTFVGASSAVGGTTTVNVPAPSGVASGQYQLLIIGVGTSGETMTTVPSGWALVESLGNAGGADSFGTFVYESTTDTGTAGFVKSGTRGFNAVRLAWDGQVSVAGGDLVAGGSTGTTHAVPVQTVASAPALVIGVVNTDNTDQQYGSPLGWTMRHASVANSNEGVGIAVADFATANTGTVNGSFTTSLTDFSNTFSITLTGTSPAGPTQTMTPTAIATGAAVGIQSVDGAITEFKRQNDFEMGVDESNITAANSVASGQDALNSYVATGTLPKYDTAQAAHGSVSMRAQHTGSLGGSNAGWSFTSNTQTHLHFRTYLYLSAYPTIDRTMIRLGNSADTAVLSIVLSTTGMIKIGASTGADLTTAVPLNTWVRLEGRVTTFGVTTRLYTSPESSTITDTATYSTGIAPIGTIRFGVDNTTADGPWWFDDIAVGSQTWIGPVPVPAQTASPTGFDDADVVGTPTVSTTLTCIATGVATAEAFGTANANVIRSTAPTAIATSEAFGTASANAIRNTAPTAISSAEAFGTLSISSTITASGTGISTALAFGTTSISNILGTNPTGISTSEVFGTLSASFVIGVTPTGFDDSDVVGNPTVSLLYTASPSGISSAESFGTASVSQLLTLLPVSIATALAFGNPSVLPLLTAVPTGFNDSSVVGNPSISASVLLSPTAISTSLAFGTVSISQILNVSPTGLISAESFGTLSLSGVVIVSPLGFDDGSVVGTPSVASGLTLSPSGFSDPSGFGVPTIQLLLNVAPSGIATTETFGTVTHINVRYMTVTGIATSLAFGTPTVNSVIAASPAGIVTALALGTPSVTKLLTVTPLSITSVETFGLAVLLSQLTATPTGIATLQALGIPTSGGPAEFIGWGIPMGIGLTL